MSPLSTIVCSVYISEGGSMSNAGWYPDPAGSGRQRYFDGQNWTEHFSPVAPQLAPGQYAQPIPVAKSKKSPIRVLLAVVGAVVVFFAVTTAIGEKSGNSGGNTAEPGTVASDGQFTFNVAGVTRSTKESLMADPQGEWVVVAIDIANTGDKAATFFPGNQKLIDAEGREYDADTAAAYSFNDDSVMADLNPGLAVRINVPFDVTPGLEIDAVELHDSAFSGGVRIALVNPKPLIGS
jgi:hypothetical protein